MYPETDERSQYRVVLEWACNRIKQAKSLEEAKEVWDSFPVLHKAWQFKLIKNKKKKELTINN